MYACPIEAVTEGAGRRRSTRAVAGFRYEATLGHMATRQVEPKRPSTQWHQVTMSRPSAV